MNLKFKHFAIALVLLAAWLPVSKSLAQSDPQVSPPQVSYIFGENIQIQVEISPEAGIDSVTILVRLAGNGRLIQAQMSPGPNGQWTYQHQNSRQFIRAFSTVEYFFQGLQEGTIAWESEVYKFDYTDNRFAWRSLERGPFRLNWYAGDPEFANQVLDTSIASHDRIGSLLETEISFPVEIYLYDTLEAYRFTQGQLGQAWAGGHADPGAGLVILSLAPGPEQQLDIDRKLPHEIAHLLLYERTGSGFWNLPVWLNEGFASFAETFQNPDYEALLAATAPNMLLEMASLCAAFPQSNAGALQAYAQSTSFVRYVAGEYGMAGLRALIDSYAAGAGCPTGSRVSPINLDLAGLEDAWLAGRQTEPRQEDQDQETALAPWLLVSLVTLAAPVILGAVFLIRRQ